MRDSINNRQTSFSPLSMNECVCVYECAIDCLVASVCMLMRVNELQNRKTHLHTHILEKGNV